MMSFFWSEKKEMIKFYSKSRQAEKSQMRRQARNIVYITWYKSHKLHITQLTISAQIINKTMTQPSSPLYLINMIGQIREQQKKLTKNNTTKEIESLFEVILQHHAVKPKVQIGGKKCTNCEHRMNCKSIRCPMCHAEMRKRKRQGCQENNKQENNKQENNKQEITPYIKSIDEIQADWEWENKDAIADELKYILSLDCYKQYKQSSGACDCSSGACDCVNPFKSNPIENFFKNLN